MTARSAVAELQRVQIRVLQIHAQAHRFARELREALAFPLHRVVDGVSLDRRAIGERASALGKRNSEESRDMVCRPQSR